MEELLRLITTESGTSGMKGRNETKKESEKKVKNRVERRQ